MSRKDLKVQPTSGSPGIAKPMVAAVFVLVDPEKYEGWAEHPAYDNTRRGVKAATITPCSYSSTGWVNLKIEFEDGKVFTSSSPSVRGAKQQFAFQCEKGSVWRLSNGS